MSSLPKEYVDAMQGSPSLLDQIVMASCDQFEAEFQLLTKLRLARQVFADRLRLWVETRKKLQDEEDFEKRVTSLSACASLLQVAIEEYLAVAEKIVKIDTALGERVSAESIRQVLLGAENLPEPIKRLLGGGSDQMVLSPAELVKALDYTVLTDTVDVTDVTDTPSLKGENNGHPDQSGAGAERTASVSVGGGSSSTDSVQSSESERESQEPNDG